jgi:hypothetical protein
MRGGGEIFCLAGYLSIPTGGPMTVGARVRVANDDGNFTTVVFAESLQEVERIVKDRYPGSGVKIAFPLEPECFFAGGPEATGALTEPMRPS